MFRGRTRLSTAAFGLIVGLIATAIHSLSDFGQHVPAVFSLTAVVSGLLVAIARYEKRKTVSSRTGQGEHQSEKPARRRLAVGAALVGLGLVWWWAGTHSLAAHRGESWRAVADTLAGRLQKYDWQAEDQDFVDLLAAAEHAAGAEPKNVRHGYLLNYYRWRSISRTLDAETGQLLLHPDVVPFVSQIVDELAQVRSLCPTYGPPFGLEGELRLLVLKEPEGERLIRLAAKLSPFHAPSCLLAGQLAAQQGSVEEASALLDRAVQLDPRHFGTVVQAYLFQLQRSDLAEALADDHGKLTQLAQLLDESDPPIDEYTRLAERLRATALKRLRERMEIGEASAGDLAHLAGVEARDENYKAAIGLYRRALVLDYDKNSWRMALARALVKVGETDQAMREARICLRLHPGSQAATQLIGELSVLP